MPVPDKTIFGIDDRNVSIDYGFVRQQNEPNELIKLLKLRLDTFLIKQVEPITGAFPKTTMTCITIETLGDIFYGNKKDDQSYGFVSVAKQLHQQFSCNVGKEFKKNLNELWDGTDDVSNIDTLAKLLYKFFRNTMVHGYYGRGVYLSFEDTTWFIKDKGYITINPNWYWDKTKDMYDKFFYEALNGDDNNPKRINCLKYIEKMLK